jgi:hypothetical protein
VHDKEEVYFDVPNANGHVYIIKLPWILDILYVPMTIHASINN